MQTHGDIPHNHGWMASRQR